MLDVLEVLIQFVHERNSGRNVQPNDIIGTDIVQVLDECGVSVCRNQNLLSGLKLPV